MVNRENDPNSCDDSRRHPAAYAILSIVSTPKIASLSWARTRPKQLHRILKKNLNAPRPSEHPPVRGGKCQNV